MLSPGEFYKKVPREPVANVKFRMALLKRCKGDKAFQGAVIEACRRDIFFFINAFVLQFNPEHFGKETGPFLTWDFQDEAIRQILSCVEDREDAVWQKSREVGASWLILIVVVWLCLFHPRKKALVISQDADGVDRPDDPDCLFWKIRFILEHLPDWMTRGAAKRKMGFRFPGTNSTINGEANTVKAGVGGRGSIVIFDEFGQFKDGLEIFSRTADTSHCRVFIFTHKNTQSMAYDLCFDVKYSQMRKIVTHWSQHPEKNRGLYRYDAESNRVEVLDKTYAFPPDFAFVMSGMPSGGPFPGIRSPWYDKECIRRPARAVAMDLDIDPRGSSEQFFDEFTIKYLKNTYACEPVWVGDLEYDRSTGRPYKLVKNPKGLIRLWIQPRADGSVPAMRVVGGSDLSWGTGATASCLSFASVRTGEKILEYVNPHISPLDAAPLFVALAWLFCDEHEQGATLCWEIQGPGVVFGRKVIELGYRNVYMREEEDALGAIRTNRMLPGWNPTPKSIMALMAQYRDALKELKFINKSWNALDECLNFVFTSAGVEYKKKGKGEEIASAARVHHGDVAVADALCNKMLHEAGFEVKKPEIEDSPTWNSVEGRRKMRQREEERELEYT